MKWIDLSKQWEYLKPEILNRIQKVLLRQDFVEGKEVFELEQVMSERIGSEMIACRSGTDALCLALKAMGVKPGDGILTSCFSFIATANAICQVGAIPLFCDIEPENVNLTQESLAKTYERYQAHKGDIPFSGKIRGVLAVNLFGTPCDYSSINTWAQKHNLFVIEDAAQSIGATYEGRPSGSLAHISVVSFYPTKPLGGYGQAGGIFCTSSKQVKRVRSQMNYGISSQGYTELGFNSRLDTIQAAILLVKLTRFDEELAQRQKLARRYLSTLHFKTPLNLTQKNSSSWSIFSILTSERGKMIEKLKQQKIPSQIYYKHPLSHHPFFAKMGYPKNCFPNAESMCQQIISIPLYSDLCQKEQNRIILALQA